eukprot:scaffold2234_cov165-Amphora_coffeaeformis.AAC.4
MDNDVEEAPNHSLDNVGAPQRSPPGSGNSYHYCRYEKGSGRIGQRDRKILGSNRHSVSYGESWSAPEGTDTLDVCDMPMLEQGDARGLVRSDTSALSTIRRSQHRLEEPSYPPKVTSIEGQFIDQSFSQIGYVSTLQHSCVCSDTPSLARSR